MFTLSDNGPLEGPVGGDTVESCPAEIGRSLNAFGPVGGGLPDAKAPVALSAAVVPRFGTEPNAGADGATGGGETSLVCVGGSG